MKKLIITACVLFISMAAFAVTKSQEDYKQELLDKGYLFGCAPANWSLIEPIRGGFNYAVMKNRTDIMELEVKAGLDPLSCSKYNITNAVNKKSNDALKLLIQYGYNPLDNGNGVIYSAIMFQNSEALSILLKNGFDANTQHLDHSFLTFAIYRKNADAVKILLENGADPNLNHGSKNPLNSAIKKKQPEIVKMLLDAGAKPNEKTLKLVKRTRNEEIKELFKQ